MSFFKTFQKSHYFLLTKAIFFIFFIKLKSLPKNESSIAEIQNNLGIAHFYLGDTTKAMNLLKQAMDIYQNLSEDCMGYANTLHN